MNKLFRIFNESQQSHHFGKNWKAAEDIEFKVGCSIVKLSACLSSLSQESAKLNHRNRRKNQKQLTFLSLHFTLRKAKSISIPILSILKRKYFLRHMIHVLTMVLYSLDSSMENAYLIIIFLNQQLPRDAGERGGRGEHHGRHAGGHPAQRP